MATPEELEKQYNKQNSTQTTTTTTTTTLPKYEAQVDAVNKAYDAANSASMAALENAYNQSKAQTEAAAQKIPATYQAQANSVAAQAERNRQAFNESAAASGLNVGTGSQAALAQNNQLQNDLTTIRTAEANAKQNLDNQLNQLYTAYQGNIAEALANNEYERANQLLSEYRQAASSAVTVAQNQASLDRYAEETAYNRAQTDAATLAKYGDFSGYAALGYTSEQIAAMRQIWEYQNPELAAAQKASQSVGGPYVGGPSDGPEVSEYQRWYNYLNGLRANGKSMLDVSRELRTAVQYGRISEADYAALVDVFITNPDAEYASILGGYTPQASAPALGSSQPTAGTQPVEQIPYSQMQDFLEERIENGDSKLVISRDLREAFTRGDISQEVYERLAKEVMARSDYDSEI